MIPVWITHHTVGCQIVFLICIIPFTFISSYSTLSKSFPFSLLFACLFQYGLMDSNFILCFLISLFIVMQKLLQLRPVSGNSLKLASVSFLHVPIVHWMLLSGLTRFSRHILLIPYSSPRICHFLKKTWFLLVEDSI